MLSCRKRLGRIIDCLDFVMDEIGHDVSDLRYTHLYEAKTHIEFILKYELNEGRTLEDDKEEDE